MGKLRSGRSCGQKVAKPGVNPSPEAQTRLTTPGAREGEPGPGRGNGTERRGYRHHLPCRQEPGELGNWLGKKGTRKAGN